MRLRSGLAALIGVWVLSAAGVALADPPVVGIEVHGEGERADVIVRGAFDVPTYAVRTRDGGNVVVIDVAGATLPDDGVATAGTTSLVASTQASTTSRG